jgi:hypothetical protein
MHTSSIPFLELIPALCLDKDALDRGMRFSRDQGYPRATARDGSKQIVRCKRIGLLGQTNRFPLKKKQGAFSTYFRRFD